MLKKYKNILKNVLTNIGDRDIIKTTKQKREKVQRRDESTEEKTIEREVQSTKTLKS